MAPNSKKNAVVVSEVDNFPVFYILFSNGLTEQMLLDFEMMVFLACQEVWSLFISLGYYWCKHLDRYFW